MNSRDTMDWCSKSSCNNPKVLCDNMLEDLLHAIEIKKRFPDKIHLVRYEDLCLQPFQQTDQLLEFLNLLRLKLWESMAGSVIQATGTVEFEDGFRTGVHSGGCWCPCGGCT